MLQLRFWLATLLAGLAAAALPAQVSRFRTTTNQPLSYHELMYLGDATLQTALKLTAEQVKQVSRSRDRLLRTTTSWGAMGKGGRVGRATKDEADKFLTDTLDAKQRERLRQVTLQQLAQRPGRMPTEALKGLDLTAKQREDLRSGNAKLEDVLTKDQKKTWEKMTGANFPHKLTAELPPSRTIRGGDSPFVSVRSQPEAMRVLRRPAARMELSLSEDQVKALDAAASNWQEANRGPTRKARADSKAADVAYEAAVASTLRPSQQRLLERLVIRQGIPRLNDEDVFRSDRAVQYLGLNDEERRKGLELLKGRHEALADLLGAAESSRGLREKVAAFRAETRKSLDTLLTPAQRKKLHELLGDGLSPEPPSTPARATVTLLMREFGTYLWSPEVPDLLKLTPGEKAKLTEMRVRLFEEARAGVSDDLLRRLDRQLIDLLGAARRQRLREVVLQQVEAHAATRTGGHAVWSMPEVVEGLKLTGDQAGKLTATGNPDSLLSDEQKKLWKAMKGEPYAGTLTLPGFAGRDAGNAAVSPPVRYGYLARADVQKELKLTTEQIDAVRAIPARWRELTRGSQGWEAKERGARLAKATEAIDGQLGQMLRPEQARRLDQILMQNLTVSGRGADPVATISPPDRAAPRALPGQLRGLLTYPPAVKALGLSDEQRKAVTAVVRDHQGVMDLIRSELRGVRDRPEPRGRAEESCTSRAEKRLGKLLTEKQAAQVKELVGDPFRSDPIGRTRRPRDR